MKRSSASDGCEEAPFNRVTERRSGRPATAVVAQTMVVPGSNNTNRAPIILVSSEDL